MKFVDIQYLDNIEIRYRKTVKDVIFIQKLPWNTIHKTTISMFQIDLMVPKLCKPELVKK